MVDLTRTNSAATTDTLANEVKNRMSEISGKMAILTEEAGSSVEMVAELDEKISSINDLLNSTDGIIALKLQRLTASAAAEKMLAKAEQQTTDALSALNQLLAKARTAAGDIQSEAESSVSNAILMIFIVVIISIALAAGIALLTVRQHHDATG